MNPDVERIRKSKLFSKLPERAFHRVLEYIKVRAYEAGEEVLSFSAPSQFAEFFGYVVSGEVLFLDAQSKPLGLSIKDEFFLGRPFSLNDSSVAKIFAASDATFVVFVPRSVIALLASASVAYSDMIEDIYESIFERAKIIQAEPKANEKIQGWLRNRDASETIAGWVQAIEKRRSDGLRRKSREKRHREKIFFVWAVGLASCFLLSIECLARFFHIDFSFSYLVAPHWQNDAYKPGSNFNIAIGMIGYLLLLATNGHTFTRWAIRRWKWKIDYQFSQELHMFFGFLGLLFVLLHSAFQLNGVNVANLAVYGLVVVVGSGLVGQFISNQIPKSIRGEMLKLDQLKAEQARLQEKAVLLMNDPDIYKTSIRMLADVKVSSAAGAFFLAPVYWFRARKLRDSLEDMGLSEESASLASSYVLREVKLRQRVQFLEVSNIFFKRWMMVHRPVGYVVYLLATIHVIAVLI